MKELDKFFEALINEGAMKKSNPSKIYPILKQMEELNLVLGENVKQNDKTVTYYMITEKGEYFLNYIFSRFILHEKNPQWKLIYDDLISEV